MAQLYKTRNNQMYHAGKLALVLVGLPASGKSYVSHKLSHYLQWLGVKSRAFNLAVYREKMFGKQKHDFFDPDNKELFERRKILLEHCLADIKVFLHGDGQVAILDGTNVLAKQRKHIYDRLTPKGVQVIFIELKNTDPSISQEIFFEEMTTSPNYAGFVPSEAGADLKARIDHYNKIYEPIGQEEAEFSYIKLLNIAEQLVVHNVKGYLQTRIVFFLMNVGVGFRNIFLYRDNCGVDGQFYLQGGRTSLSTDGKSYAKKLRELVLEQMRTTDGFNFGDPNQPLSVWTSPNARSKDIGDLFLADGEVKEMNALADMNPGVVDGMKKEEIKEKYPLEFSEYEENIYNYRFPRAESYHDVSVRLEPIISELERARGHVLVIAQQHVLKCLYSYLTDLAEEATPLVDIPEYCVIQLRPRAYTCLNKLHHLN